MMRIRPSKPMAVFGAIVGVAILAFGISAAARSEDTSIAFMGLWVVVGVGIIGMNLWAAFGRNGATHTIDSDSR